MDDFPIIVLGAGGHARVLIDALLLRGENVLGVVAPEPGLQPVLGVPALGNDDILERYTADSVRLVNGIGSIFRPASRREIYERFRARGYAFHSVVHPAAIVARDVRIGEGVQVMAGAVIQTGSHIGPNVIVNTRAAIDHDCMVGAHTHIAPGATLCGGVVVGEDSHVGTGSTVVQGIAIGQGSLVGAGSLVIRDVASGVKVAGVPARKMAQ